MRDTLTRDHACPPRAEQGQATHLPGSPLNSLDEARSVPDAAVILMRALRRATVYATCPGSLARCDAAALEQLAADLDILVWPELPAGGLVSFERRPVGSRIVGDLGGGRIVPGIWVHSRLVEMGLERRIRAVLEGWDERLIAPAERVYAVARVDEERMRYAAQNRFCVDAFPYPLPVEVVRMTATFEGAQAEVDRLNAEKHERAVYFMTWGPLTLPHAHGHHL